MLRKNFWLLPLLLLLAAGLNAQEEGEASGAVRAIYIPLKPPFVVNYGGPGRLRYMKVEVSVRLANPGAANSIRHHMPYIRNDLILLFSRQNEETLDTVEGKEQLRQQAKAAVERILKEEDDEDGLMDLYFNQLVLQK
ncbi:flagellar basal body rod protein [Pseudomaricurvus alcaniphilus]|uniref:flagellar basal body-associated FliL family protein n=1 Tax=Pseudomaricurvus alcaniphilus TaxID=1166482 RepID=UPI00140A133C|nr:flagellar basal body rod protein [Pseudomaricurvus alcaniphilus]